MNNDAITPEMQNAIAVKNALAFIVSSLADDPEFSLSFIAEVDTESLFEFALDNDFTPDAFYAAIALLKKIRAQLEF